MTTGITCPKCESEMTEGYVLDRGLEKLKLTSVWVEGEPEGSFWSGGLKTSNREVFRIQAFRCSKCYYLEFYTAEQVYI